MSDLVTRAQVEILAASLHVEPKRLAHLERLGAEKVEQLQRRISDKIFDHLDPMFARVNKASVLVPNALVAKVTMALIPPLVAGRAAGSIGVAHPGRINDLLARLTPEFMADCSAHLDPRAVAILAPQMPPEVIVPVANELLRRKDYVTASRFIESAPDDLVRAAETGIPDDEGLLRTAVLTPSVERLGEIVKVLPWERVEQITRTAGNSDETLLAATSLLGRMDPELCGPLATAFFGSLDDKELDKALATILDNGADAELRHIVASVPDDLRERIQARPRTV